MTTIEQILIACRKARKARYKIVRHDFGLTIKDGKFVAPYKEICPLAAVVLGRKTKSTYCSTDIIIRAVSKKIRKPLRWVAKFVGAIDANEKSSILKPSDAEHAAITIRRTLRLK